MPLKLGDQIPDFSLSDQLGVSRTNKQAKGRPLVLFFYPKDDTPGCTKEAIDFSSYKRKFEKLNTQVIGISKDSIAKHNKFKLKHKISVNLASDEDISVCKKFKFIKT